MSSIASIVHRAHRPLSAMLVATALLAGAPTVLAQDGAPATAADAELMRGLRKNVEDFVHYVLIGKGDLARTAAEAALGASASDADLAIAVDESGVGERLDRAFSRSRAMGDVSDLASRIENRVEAGRRALARDPQRIAQSIEMLGKTLREKLLAEERIAAAGEYAVPQLLKVVVDGTNPALELQASRRLVELKRVAALPLAMSLSGLDNVAQRKVVGILSEIGWPTAIPFILEVAGAPGTSEETKAACMSAFTQLGGTTSDVSAQFTALARKFFDREDALVAYPGDPANNLWSYGEGSGLVAEPVATSVFSDVMAMTLARRALAADSANTGALAIYVAADLRRENTLGSDAQPGRYSPQFFATASGPSVCAEVLGMALDSLDHALARDAIAALSQTAGGNALVAPAGRASILEALRSSDRRVRLDAALAIANAAPAQSFPSDFAVVPTLVSVFGGNVGARAAVLGGSMEDREAISGNLTAAGFVTVAGAQSFDALEVDVVKADGVDIIVLRGDAAGLKEQLGRVRASGLTAASPVVAIANALEETEVRRTFDGDRSVVVWTEGGTSETFRNAATGAVMAMSGSVMDESETAEYQIRATEALRGLAFGSSKVFKLSDAEPALLRALGTTSGGLRMLVAEVLALGGSADSQRMLIDAALAATGDEQVTLLDYAAVAARKGGAAASESQMSALRGLIGSSEGATADAAGRLYGSLDAGAAEAIKLITK